MAEVLKNRKLGAEKVASGATTRNDERSRLRTFLTAAGATAATVLVIAGCGDKVSSPTIHGDVSTPNGDILQHYEDTAHADGDSVNGFKKTCAEKKADGAMTYYTITLNGKETKVQDGDLVEEKGTAYRVTVNENGLVTLKAGVDKDGEFTEKEFKVTVDGSKHLVNDGDKIVDKLGNEWTVHVFYTGPGQLEAFLDNESGVEKSVEGVEKTDVVKATAAFTTSYLNRNYVLNVSGQDGEEKGKDPRTIVGEGNENEFTFVGKDGTTLHLWLSGETDAQGRPTAVYQFQVPGQSNWSDGSLTLTKGVVVNAGALTVVVESEGQAVHGDAECVVARAKMTVTDGSTSEVAMPEGTELKVAGKTTIKVNTVVVGTEGSPHCAEVSVETAGAQGESPNEGSAMNVGRVICGTDANKTLTSTAANRTPATVTAEFVGAETVSGPQAVQEGSQ